MREQALRDLSGYVSVLRYEIEIDPDYQHDAAHGLVFDEKAYEAAAAVKAAGMVLTTPADAQTAVPVDMQTAGAKAAKGARGKRRSAFCHVL